MKFDSWKIIEDFYSQKLNKNYEGLFTQGNGYISIRGSFEEELSDASQNDKYWRMPANVTLEKPRHPKSKWGVFVPGIVGMHPILNEEMINLPYPLGLNVYIEGSRFDMEESLYEDYMRELDLKSGILNRKLIWTKDGKRIELSFSRYVSMVRKNIIVQNVRIKPIDKDIDFMAESFIEGDVTTNGYNHYLEKEGITRDGFIGYRVKTDMDKEVIMLSRLLLPKGLEERFFVNKDKVIDRVSIHIPCGEEFIINKLTVVKTSNDINTANLFRDSVEELDKGVKEYNSLYDEHINAWKARWSICDIEIEGDERSQRALRFSIYHLLRVINEDDDRIAIDAKGAAGEAYFGHYFWDTEIYLLPFYLYTNPQAAKNLLMFRSNTLDGAKENAKEYGYKGAKYPWESSISGKEQCSNWQYKDFEVHINADIVYAIWNYYRVTGDYDTLFNKFFDIMYEISRFWVERVDREKDGTYSIKGVMGPDEYLVFTNNNAYTNYMVKYCLKKTLETLDMIGEYDKKLYNSKFLSLKILEDELILMRNIINSMNIPIDYEKNFIWQCDNFDKFLDLDFNKIWLDRNRAFGNYISQEKNYRSKALKQADVVALLYLFSSDFNKETQKNCIDYYEPITTHDSSLSYIIHSALYSKLNERERAYDFFKKSVGIDLYNNGASEGIHIANCGAIWQAVVFGFCGLENMMFNSEIKLNPSLPEAWKRVKFKIFYKGRLYTITVTHEGVNIA